MKFVVLVTSFIAISCAVIRFDEEKCHLSSGFEKQFICAYMIVNTTNTLKKQCILEAFYRGAYSTVVLMELNDLMTRNILKKPNIINCNTYIFLIEDISLVNILFSHVGGHGRFYPFTNIMIIFALDSKIQIVFDRNIFQYITKNSLNVAWTHYQNFNNNTGTMKFHRVLSDELVYIHSKKVDRSRKSGWSEMVKLFDEDELVNTLIRNKHNLMNIRASFFKCPPFIYYNKDVKENRTKFDGIEYRLLNETTKNWRRKYTLRDFSNEVTDPWTTSLSDLSNNISDISMCSVWMTESHYHDFDLSRGYDTQCATFVVPKPVPLTQASLIYLPLDFYVWIIFITTMFTTIILLRFISYCGAILFNNRDYEKQFSNIILAIVEVINIVTSHGVPHFPIYLPTKVLIISWTYFSLLLGTGYTTGYTSLLTSPEYSKSIDKISDFIDQGIVWGEAGKYSGFMKELRETNNPQIIEIANRFREEKNIKDVVNCLEHGKYGKFTKVLSKSFVTESDSYVHLSSSLQVMKQCLSQYVTTFAFQKQSPYKKIFNRQIPRIVESGILQMWFRDLSRLYGDSRMQNFFDKSFSRQSDTKPLTMGNIVGAFYLLLFGLGFAMVIFSFETLLARKNRQIALNHLTKIVWRKRK